MARLLGHLGIRAKLFLAFGAIASTTVVATVAGWLSLMHIGGLLDGIATRSIPDVVATLQLSTETQALVASAPNLLTVDSQERRTEQRKGLQDLQERVARQLDVVARLETGQETIGALRSLVAELNEKLNALDRSVATRLDQAAQRVALAKQTDAIQSKIESLTRPVLEKAQTDITMVSMTLGGDASDASATLLSLVSRQVPFIEGMSDLSGDVGLLATLLDRSDLAPDAGTVTELNKTFTGTVAHATERLDVVEALLPTPGLRETIEQLFQQGSGERGAFAIRLKELDAQQQGRSLLVETRGVAAKLASEVARQAEVVHAAAVAATDRSHSAIGFGTALMLAIAGVSVVGAALIVWLYIGRSLVARIVSLGAAMLRLANGDLAAEIPATDRNDEVGQMA
jgi:phosphoglycerate-specific signal transduction histidine kinase